jgi:hypothetical protein
MTCVGHAASRAPGIGAHSGLPTVLRLTQLGIEHENWYVTGTRST